MNEPTMSFLEMMDELRSIIRGLEADELDVDRVVADVARANQLIGWCTDRIDAAKSSLDELRPTTD